jgi:hypothetical protein
MSRLFHWSPPPVIAAAPVFLLSCCLAGCIQVDQGFDCAVLERVQPFEEPVRLVVREVAVGGMPSASKEHLALKACAHLLAPEHGGRYAKVDCKGTGTAPDDADATFAEFYRVPGYPSLLLTPYQKAGDEGTSCAGIYLVLRVREDTVSVYVPELDRLADWLALAGDLRERDLLQQAIARVRTEEAAAAAKKQAGESNKYSGPYAYVAADPEQLRLFAKFIAMDPGDQATVFTLAAD